MLFEPTLPESRAPKPRKAKSKKKRRKINTGRLWSSFIGLVLLAVGVALIVAHRARVEAGNPPQGEWGGFGALVIIAVFACVLLDSTEGKNWRRRR